ARALDADPARDRLLPGQRLEAAAAATAAALPVERAHREVADLAGEATGAGEDRTVDDHRAADADVAVDQEAVTDAAQRAALELAERGEIGVVADVQAEAGVAEGFAQAVDDRQLIPAEVGRVDQRAGLGLDCARNRDARADRGQPETLALAQRLAHELREQLEGERRRARPVVVPDRCPEADGTAQVAHARGDVVDVDLQAESGDATVVELEDLRGATDPSAVREARLGDDTALDQLGDEARDRRLVEPGELCKLCARERPALRDAPRDE